MKKVLILAVLVIFGAVASVQAAFYDPAEYWWNGYTPAVTGLYRTSGADTEAAAFYGYTGGDYTGYYIGTFAGNTNTGDPGEEDVLVGLASYYFHYLTGGDLLIASIEKVDGLGGTDGALTVTSDPGGLTGEWSLANPYQFGFYAVKGATEFALYYVQPPQSSGDWTTRHLLNNGGQIPQISHLSGLTTTTTVVPEPSTAMLLGLGLLGLGAVARRRR